jgi:hypothetical protein
MGSCEPSANPWDDEDEDSLEFGTSLGSGLPGDSEVCDQSEQTLTELQNPWFEDDDCSDLEKSSRPELHGPVPKKPRIGAVDECGSIVSHDKPDTDSKAATKTTIPKANIPGPREIERPPCPEGTQWWVDVLWKAVLPFFQQLPDKSHTLFHEDFCSG